MKKNDRPYRFKLFVPFAVILICSFNAAVYSRANSVIPDEWQNIAKPLSGIEALTPLIEETANARLALLGEASHGTHEFYTYRAEISKQLISEHGFNFIVVEGDWELLQILNSYILDLPGAPESAREALMKFDRWPLWMWANSEMVALAEWLRSWNEPLPSDQKVGIYGMDVYGMWDSLDAVIAYIEEYHPGHLSRVNSLFANLKRFHGDGHAYVRSLARGGESSAIKISQVMELIRNLPDPETEDARRRRFMAEQNAWVVNYGERHFRGMLARGPESWNHRVEHMKKTVARLLEKYGHNSRGIVWAHNTHIGDARATSMAAGNQKNIGQLARQRWGVREVYAIGFGTHHGNVMAGRSWGGEPQKMTVPKAMENSLENLLASIFKGNVLLFLGEADDDLPISRVLGHRAIGVIYHPEREQPGNYVPTRTTSRYDAFIFLLQTEAVNPLH